MELDFRVTPSRYLLAASLGVILGVATHAFDERAWFGANALGAATAVLMPLVVSWPRLRGDWLRLAAVLMVAVVASAARYDMALMSVPGFISPPSGQHEFVGTVASSDGLMTSLTVRGVAMDGEAVPFSVRVTGVLPNELLPGDVVTWSGRARAAAPADRASGLVLLGKAGWVSEAADLAIDADAAPPAWSPERSLGQARAALRDRLYAIMPATEATLLLGLLTGEQSGLPPKVTQAFRDTGTAHVLAVSGYNISQVVNLALVLFVVAALPRRRALAAAGTAVLGFTWFVGAGPSVVRAALMGVLGLVARGCGRRYDARVALALSAALMLLANPFILRYDLGFRLSFAAVLGLMLLAAPLSARLKRLRPRFAADALATTLAATFFTLPISLAEFGTLAYVSPLVNVLIAPLVEALMLIGPAVLVLTAILPWLGPVFGLAAWLPLKALITVVMLCAVIQPWPVRISVVVEIGLYAVMTAWAVRWHRRRREQEEDEL